MPLCRVFLIVLFFTTTVSLLAPTRYIYIPKIQQREEIHLEGYYDHKIGSNTDTGQWEIMRVDIGTVGTLSTEHHYPFGKHVWNLNTSKISGNIATYTKETLKLSLVSHILI